MCNRYHIHIKLLENFQKRRKASIMWAKCTCRLWVKYSYIVIMVSHCAFFGLEVVEQLNMEFIVPVAVGP